MNEQPEYLALSIQYRKAFYRKLKELYKMLFDILKDYGVINDAESKTASFYELLQRINDIDTYYGQTLDIHPETFYEQLTDTGTPNNRKYYHAEINFNGWEWLENTFTRQTYFNHIVWTKILSYKYYLKTFLIENGIPEENFIKYNSKGHQVELTFKELIEALNSLPMWEETEIRINAYEENGTYIAYDSVPAYVVPIVYTKKSGFVENKNIKFYIDDEEIEVYNPNYIDFTLYLSPNQPYEDKECRIVFEGYDNYKPSEFIFTLRLQPSPYILTGRIANTNILSPFYETLEDTFPEVIITEESIQEKDGEMISLIQGYIEEINIGNKFVIKASIDGQIINENIRLYNDNHFHFRHTGSLDIDGNNYDYGIYWNGVKIYHHPIYDVQYLSDAYIDDNHNLIVDKQKLKRLRNYPYINNIKLDNNANLIVNKENYKRTDDIHTLLSEIYWTGDNITTKTISEDIQLSTTPLGTIGFESDTWNIYLRLTDAQDNPQPNAEIKMYINEDYITTFYTDINGEINQDYSFDFSHGRDIVVSFQTQYGDWRDTEYNEYLIIYHDIFSYNPDPVTKYESGARKPLTITCYNMNTGEINTEKGKLIQEYNEELGETIEYYLEDATVIINGQSFTPTDGIIQYSVTNEDELILTTKEFINEEYLAFSFIKTVTEVSNFILPDTNDLHSSELKIYYKPNGEVSQNYPIVDGVSTATDENGLIILSDSYFTPTIHNITLTSNINDGGRQETITYTYKINNAFEMQKTELQPDKVQYDITIFDINSYTLGTLYDHVTIRNNGIEITKDNRFFTYFEEVQNNNIHIEIIISYIVPLDGENIFEFILGTKTETSNFTLTPALVTDVTFNNGDLEVSESFMSNTNFVTDINLNNESNIQLDTTILLEGDDYQNIVSKIDLNEDRNLIVKKVNDLL